MKRLYCHECGEYLMTGSGEVDCACGWKQPADEPEPLTLEPYDAGLLNDFGGGNVGWWHDYIRAELERAHDFYQSQLDGSA